LSLRKPTPALTDFVILTTVCCQNLQPPPCDGGHVLTLLGGLDRRIRELHPNSVTVGSAQQWRQSIKLRRSVRGAHCAMRQSTCAAGGRFFGRNHRPQHDGRSWVWARYGIGRSVRSGSCDRWQAGVLLCPQRRRCSNAERRRRRARPISLTATRSTGPHCRVGTRSCVTSIVRRPKQTRKASRCFPVAGDATPAVHGQSSCSGPFVVCGCTEAKAECRSGFLLL
jgi:hypothetical protein